MNCSVVASIRSSRSNFHDCALWNAAVADRAGVKEKIVAHRIPVQSMSPLYYSHLHLFYRRSCENYSRKRGPPHRNLQNVQEEQKRRRSPLERAAAAGSIR